MALPFLGKSQEAIFKAYKDNPKVTFMSLKPKMFQMIAEMGINLEDKTAADYINMVKSITSYKTLITTDSAITNEIATWIDSKANTLEPLMEHQESGKIVKFYGKTNNEKNYAKELLIFVNALNTIKATDTLTTNLNTAKETSLILFTGHINLNEISKLTDKMSIPGGLHLSK